MADYISTIGGVETTINVDHANSKISNSEGVTKIAEGSGLIRNATLKAFHDAIGPAGSKPDLSVVVSAAADLQIGLALASAQDEAAKKLGENLSQTIGSVFR